MKRIFVLAMAGSLVMAACGRGDLSATAPTNTSAATGATPVANSFAVGGMIESIDKPTRGIAGAMIQVTKGPNAGKSALSDDSGAFAIFGLTPGLMGLQVSKSGYVAWSSKDFDFQADTKLAVELFPAPPLNASGASATGRCNDGTWTWSTSPADACVNSGGMAYGVCPGPLCKSGA